MTHNCECTYTFDFLKKIMQPSTIMYLPTSSALAFLNSYNTISQSADRGSFRGDLRCTNQHFPSAGAHKQIKCTSGAPLI